MTEEIEEHDYPKAPQECNAKIEFSSADGITIVGGVTHCPLTRHGYCALAFLNGEGYKTTMARGKCKLGHKPNMSDVKMMGN